MKYRLQLIVLIFISQLICAQQPETEEILVKDELLTESQAVTTLSAQAISVDSQIKDEAIKQRLENIINASQWIENTVVEVNEGIVILNGNTNNEIHSQWTESLANKTDGVVAVINRIELSNNPSWDLEPAAVETKNLFNKFIRSLPKIITGFLVLMITWILSKLVIHLSRSVLKRKIESQFILNLSARAISVPIIVIGIYLTLKVTGLTQLAITIIGGTGIAGIIIGIAFRDIAENFLASILISLQRPFKAGDIIIINDIKGMVQTVTTRGTIIMTLEGNHVQIPNSTIYKSIVVNLTANPNTRKDFTVGIGYEDNISEAQDIVLDILKQHEAILNKPEYFVLVEGLGAATVNLKIYFWIDSEKNNPSKVRSSIIRLTKRAFDSHGISMPDEAREVVFPDGIHVTTEKFTRKLNEEKTENLIEPLTNVSEQDLSSDNDEIKQQLIDNPLTDDDKSLLKGQL
ncbi:MAG: mechanosensitive ion channel domain-containing protein [Marinicellaceae bacterium]